MSLAYSEQVERKLPLDFNVNDMEKSHKTNIQLTAQRLSNEIEKSITTPLESRLVFPVIGLRKTSVSTGSGMSKGDSDGGDRIGTSAIHQHKHYKRLNGPNVNVIGHYSNPGHHSTEGSCESNRNSWYVSKSTVADPANCKPDNYSFNYIMCGWLIVAILCNQISRLLLTILTICMTKVSDFLATSGTGKAKTSTEFIRYIAGIPMIAIMWLTYVCMWLLSTVCGALLRPAPQKVCHCINLATQRNFLYQNTFRWMSAKNAPNIKNL